MKKYSIALLFLIAIQIGFAQNDQLWKGYFSYNEIKDVSQSPAVFFAAAENALFSKNLNNNVLKTTNTVDGLSGQTITAIHHSTALNRTIIGYKNGLMIVINEADGSMINVVDIISNGVNQNLKKINHFMEYNGIVYVSCDFGIVQYNLATLGFGDTYRIGNGGAEIRVTQTAVFNGFIYASTSSGIRKASITNPNLNDYNQWTTLNGNGWASIETFGTELLAVAVWGEMYRFNGVAFVNFSNFPMATMDMRNSGGYLIVTIPNTVYVYNQSLALVAQVNSSAIPEMIPKFTCATIINDTIYIGTSENGVVTTTVSNPSVFEYMNPDGPALNNIFSINTSSDNLWAVYGDYTKQYDPNPFRYSGISKYRDNQWLNIPYSEVHFPGIDVVDLVRVTVNPKNENQIFVSSYYSGLVKFENDQLVTVYNETNSTLESISASDPPYANIRIEQSAYDKAGNLWMTNGLVADGLKVLKPDGTWLSYNTTAPFPNPIEGRFGKLVIDKNQTKWMCTINEGLVGFNENVTPNFRKIRTGAEDGNLPSNDVRVATIDNKNQMWIGTTSGLRVLSSVDRFLSADPLTTNAIIILEDDLAQELLFEQFINDIVVDGANNKWIGTADSGVFLLSPNGQETIYHFTASNSPLPSNVINDIDINGKTGEVFIATDKGMVSFKGTSTEASGDLGNVIVYPNPVRPEFEGTVKISGLLNKCNVKITDIGGNLVHEAIAEGGTIEWDTKAFGKYKVASGVYMIFISAQDGVETKVKKVMIIR
ncbi:T9SS type A sorting domain-containing protein [Flavobacterium sp. GT3R68]|uniref:type IX secretion system anionic LPS delivery protein PorZ n=1 Tax=Flavobacterium sp. GT3R68 TaxID=2594437 RepID=UPI000F87AA5C|nr:T9SS type A sorting domain-containing protein [Flavobacterium sp. GT3R68]RTY95799.1 T9SS type A sorting domain-containing protein [Flavobacterium sp. GSN2]TRW93571.1 T9SS type A sorting domain-containing protein [Flavobacterium sp. GT3R68]